MPATIFIWDLPSGVFKEKAMSNSIPLQQVLREEYSALHGTLFPSEYLACTFFADHLKDASHFAVSVQDAHDDFFKALKGALPQEARHDLKKYCHRARKNGGKGLPGPQVPDDLLTAVVAGTNKFLKEDLSGFFTEEQRASAQARVEDVCPVGVSKPSTPLQARIVLNRLLLEQAYPDDIYPLNDTLSGIYGHLHKRNHSALCISGGGIRSATFALGILQGLARCKLMDKFDYMSTVSGGGYIGGWLTGWIHRHFNGERGVAEALAGRVVPTLDPEPAPLQHLRDYADYLSPRLGLLSADTWTLAAIYIRNLLLNWLVLLPLLTAVLMAPRIYAVAVDHIKNHSLDQHPFWMMAMLIGGVILGSIAISYIGRNRPSGSKKNNNQSKYLISCLLPMTAASVLLTIYWAWYRSSDKPDIPLPVFLLFGVTINVLGFLIWFVGGYSRNRRHPFYELLAVTITGIIGGLLIWRLSEASFLFLPASEAHHFHDVQRRSYLCFAVPLLQSVFVLTAMLYEGIISFYTSDEDQEWWSRSDAWNLIAIISWAAVASLVLVGPLGLASLRAYGASLGGVSGVVTILLGRSSGTQADDKQKSKPGWQQMLLDYGLKAAAAIFAIFLLVILVLAGTYLISLLGHSDIGHRLTSAVNVRPDRLFENHPDSHDWLHHQSIVYYSPLSWILPVMALLILVSSIMAVVVNINRFSLHALYRNRLIRAYLGASNTHRRPNKFTGFDPDDNIHMHCLWPINDAGKPRKKLLHVVNMALNLVGGDKLAWQERKAESFTVSPIHSGSYALGYRNSKDYGGKDGITLGTAVAISGAAASPNMGYYSSPMVTFLMALFNARLGWWLGNPGRPGDRTYGLQGPRFALKPLIAETLGLTTDRSSYVYLSDGGHFENLALYEMVRRRCHFIVVLDGSADGDGAFESLGNAVRKIRIDMGVPIEFAGDIDISPRSAGDKSDGDAQKTGKYCAIAKVQYSCVDGEGADGVLIYLKPAFYGDEPRDIYQYARANPTFPHESTADQFFTESQFESYRMLGSYIMEVIVGEDWTPIELEGLLIKCAGYVYGDSKPKWIEELLTRDPQVAGPAAKRAGA
jgi:hypothetical protein